MPCLALIGTGDLRELGRSRVGAVVAKLDRRHAPRPPRGARIVALADYIRIPLYKYSRRLEDVRNRRKESQYNTY
eukprot:6211947-Pleurochrysis_carterae.AAC.3